MGVLRDIAATLSGEVQRDGAVVRWQAFGNGARTILLLPTWSIVHTDFWRRQVPHLATRYTVLTFDGLGNGASDRPVDAAYYADQDFVTDAVNVMDAAGVDEAAVLSASMGAAWHLLLAARVPRRVAASVYIAADLPLAPLPPAFARAETHFDQHLTEHDGWAGWNRAFWHQDWHSFCVFFFSQCFTEPNSHDEISHFVSMGLETSPEVVAATIDAVGISEREARDAATSLGMPTLVIHGGLDAIASVAVGRELARLAGAELVVLPGAGHEPHCRDAAHVNAVLDPFLERHYPPRNTPS